MLSNLNLFLFTERNIGLKEVLKKKLINFNKEAEIINLYQEDINKNKNIISMKQKIFHYLQKKK